MVLKTVKKYRAWYSQKLESQLSDYELTDVNTALDSDSGTQVLIVSLPGSAICSRASNSQSFSFVDVSLECQHGSKPTF